MNRTPISSSELRKLFQKDFPEIYELASSNDFKGFHSELHRILQSSSQKPFSQFLLTLAENEGSVVHDLPSGTDITLSTLSYLYRFLKEDKNSEQFSDGALDIFFTLHALERERLKPSRRTVLHWMARWPNGTDIAVLEHREANKRRIIAHLSEKISSGHRKSAKYYFDEGLTEEQKRDLVSMWWNDVAFHLAMAARTPKEIDALLGGSLSPEERALYKMAAKKGMPFFLTPYYASLLCTDGVSYDDRAIRSYVMYSKELVDTFGSIRAWEKEDIVEGGTPNAAGWIVPEGDNIHRRYPDVAILIPDTLGRSCGGLCASCQRMYGFQSRKLHFEHEHLAPKESWPHKLKSLMHYFETDTQIRDILVTGGDALMSRNHSLELILHEICQMALRKREANKARPDGEKYAEIQRIRLGSRLPVYLPMRVNDDLVQVLKRAKAEGEKAGISQFIVQTHFQTPLEITPESADAVKKILSAGWRVTNQLVFNVAASRRGHTAKLRSELAKLGVECYYTFSVKGFDENRPVFTPNSRSVQEATVEKCWFGGTDRNVLNLPGIGKSLSFDYVGLSESGCRILCFDHDRTRAHSPVIEEYDKVYITENRSIADYLRQLRDMGERMEEYRDIWGYIHSETERRDPAFEYPDFDFRVTGELSNFAVK